jgi:leader peptidase (prepilin peptidase)/N-methyltransferase
MRSRVSVDLLHLGPVGIVFAGVLGAMIGSFLNVCILRWGADPKKSVVRPRSRCPQCGKRLAWYDNIPVISWLLLRARCRGCGKPISVQYPLIELATAGIWAYMAWRHGLTIEALRGAAFGTILLGIAMTDARAYIIPDEFTWGGLVLGLLFSLFGGLPGLTTAVLGAAVGFGLLWLIGTVGTWIFKEDAMGGGDVKMMAMVGAFVGWQGVLLTIFLGALIGSLIFLPLLMMGKKKLVPFGVFLAMGAAVAYELGPAIIGWYANYLTGA